MDAFAAVGGSLALLTLLSCIPSVDDRLRILKGAFEYLKARIDDIENIENASCPVDGRRSKKRKRDNDLNIWVAEGRELLKTAENLLTQVEDCRSFLMSAKKRKVVEKVIDALSCHDKKGDMLYLCSLCDERGSFCGNYIPVKDIIGQSALNILGELEHLLQDDKVGRVAIVGREGIGKTFLMKHLHNCVLKWCERFDYVIWVTSPDQFSIKLVQEAIAAAVKCVFASDDDKNERARKLSEALRDVGKFVLFLDGVPKSDLSLEEIGIPVPVEGSECKLVLTTRCTSRCRMLDGFRTVGLQCLSENKAFELFMDEAKLDMRSVTLLGNIPRLLARKCFGVPRMIVNTASSMYGIDDLHEWRNALFELGKIH